MNCEEAYTHDAKHTNLCTLSPRQTRGAVHQAESLDSGCTTVPNPNLDIPN